VAPRPSGYRRSEVTEIGIHSRLERHNDPVQDVSDKRWCGFGGLITTFAVVHRRCRRRGGSRGRRIDNGCRRGERASGSVALLREVPRLVPPRNRGPGPVPHRGRTPGNRLHVRGAARRPGDPDRADRLASLREMPGTLPRRGPPTRPMPGRRCARGDPLQFRPAVRRRRRPGTESSASSGIVRGWWAGQGTKVISGKRGEGRSSRVPGRPRR
jgi:hypothetical protein